MGPRGMKHEKTLLVNVICPWHSGIFLPLLTDQQLSVRLTQSQVQYELRGGCWNVLPVSSQAMLYVSMSSERLEDFAGCSAVV